MEVVTETNRYHKFIQVTSANGRVNVMRAWCFCGAECCETWWQEPTTDLFAPPNPTEPELVPDSEDPEIIHEVFTAPQPTNDDGTLLIRVAEQHGVDKTITQVEEIEVADKDALNAWWQMWP